MAEQNLEQSIFLHAIGLASPADRAVYLDQACRNSPELRAEVDALVAAHDRLGGAAPPSAPPEPTQVAFTPPSEAAGAVLGPYQLLEQIGEGGMGTVWMAEQKEPIHRRVALKVIKAGMDSKQVLARFEAERQALALMDHPNIARVLDAGVTDAGRPYFVMELVKGAPITKYCDDKHLSVRERLELFGDVCGAVQHAHQKGIIHRDLKPRNILIASFDGQPVVKVIDFGVAKATGQRLTDATLFTGFGAVVGTPEYMSPEQAETNNQDIDVRSDIFSLGVLLYELLTGSTPLTRKRVQEAAFLDVLRVIREEEPPKPSTRLSSTEELPSISAHRRTEPAKLTRVVRGELDWIVMKALEKDRNRRYETANGFAMDIERYLANEPVLACPPSSVYRLRKFARRNKGGLAVAALVLFFLVLLGSGVGWAVRDQSARQSRIGVQMNLILGEVEQLAKEQEWPEALAVARRAEALTAGGAGGATQERVRQVLNDLQMVARLEALRLREARDTEPGAKSIDEGRPHLYAAAFRDFGVDVETLPAEESMARLRARPAVANALAAALDDWARTRRPKDREQSKRLWALATALDPDPWRVKVRQASAAMDVAALVKLANAPEMARQPPQSQLLLASSIRLGDQPDQALALLERACESHPGDFWIHFTLASYSMTHPDRTSRHDRVEAGVRHSIAARALRPRSAEAWNLLGDALCLQEKLDEAITCYQKAIELDPNRASAYTDLGRALSDRRKFDAADAAYRKAIELDPKDFATYVNMGVALYDQKKLDEAVAAYHKAIEIDPKSAPAYFNLGNALHEQKKLDEAIAAYRKAIEVHPKSAYAYTNLGRVLYEQKKLDEAIAAFRKAVEVDPRSALAHNGLGVGLSDQGKLPEAIAAYRKAIEVDPKFAYAYTNLGRVLYEQKKLDEAIAAYRKAIELDPRFAMAYHNRARTYAALGQWAKAAADFERTREVDPKNDDAWRFAAYAYLAAGDAASYRRTCRELVERFGQTDDPVIAERTAKVCTLAPGAVADFGVVERLAQVAVTGTEQDGNYHYFVLAKGLTEDRAGRHAETVRWLERFAPDADRGYDFDAIAIAALAMAQHRLGRTDEAKEALAKAKAIVARNIPDRSEGRPFRAGNWQDWLHAEILIREAEDLIGVISAQELVSPRLERWDRELAALSDEVRAKPDNPEPLTNRARLYVRSGRFEQAVSDFDRLVRLAPADHWHWFHRGCLLAYLGRDAEYREHCRAMLEQFAKSQDKYVLDRTTKTALLLPRGVGGDVQRLAERARAAQPRDANDRWFGLLMGMAEFRAGRPNDAIPWLEKCRAADVPARWAAAEAFLTMAHHWLGREDEAASALAQCVQLIERDLPEAGVDDLTEGTAGIENWLIAHIARREAEELIDRKSPK